MDNQSMNAEKKYKVLSVIGGALFVLGLILCANRTYSIILHKIVSAKVTAVEEFAGECRRVSGKYETCLKAKVNVEFPINKSGEIRTGQVEIERAGPALVAGAALQVMFVDGKPETVKLADLSSGWVGPLGVLFIGVLILIISTLGRPSSKS